MTLTQYLIGLVLAFALTTVYEFRHPLWQWAREITNRHTQREDQL